MTFSVACLRNAAIRWSSADTQRKGQSLPNYFTIKFFEFTFFKLRLLLSPFFSLISLISHSSKKFRIRILSNEQHSWMGKKLKISFKICSQAGNYSLMFHQDFKRKTYSSTLFRIKIACLAFWMLIKCFELNLKHSWLMRTKDGACNVVDPWGCTRSPWNFVERKRHAFMKWIFNGKLPTFSAVCFRVASVFPDRVPSIWSMRYCNDSISLRTKTIIFESIIPRWGGNGQTTRRITTLRVNVRSERDGS